MTDDQNKKKDPATGQDNTLPPDESQVFKDIFDHIDIDAADKDPKDSQTKKTSSTTKKDKNNDTHAKNKNTQKEEKKEQGTWWANDDINKDDLSKIEWIWPKIQETLYHAGILTYVDLSWTKLNDLRKILADKWLSQHDPKTWKKQATLAKNGKWKELKILQDELEGGKEVKNTEWEQEAENNQKDLTEEKSKAAFVEHPNKETEENIPIEEKSTNTEKNKEMETNENTKDETSDKQKETSMNKTDTTQQKTQKKENDAPDTIKEDLNIGDISSYIEKTKAQQAENDTHPQALDGTDLTTLPDIYAIVPHTKWDHKIVYLKKNAPNSLLDDEKWRKKGTTYTKKWMNIYKVHVDFKEHPLFKNKNGELLDVWVIDEANDLSLQLQAIQEWKWWGSNFKTPLILNKSADTEGEREKKEEQEGKNKEENKVQEEEKTKEGSADKQVKEGKKEEIEEGGDDLEEHSGEKTEHNTLKEKSETTASKPRETTVDEDNWKEEAKPWETETKDKDTDTLKETKKPRESSDTEEENAPQNSQPRNDKKQKTNSETESKPWKTSTDTSDTSTSVEKQTDEITNDIPNINDLTTPPVAINKDDTDPDIPSQETSPNAKKTNKDAFKRTQGDIDSIGKVKEVKIKETLPKKETAIKTTKGQEAWSPDQKNLNPNQVHTKWQTAQSTTTPSDTSSGMDLDNIISPPSSEENTPDTPNQDITTTTPNNMTTTNTPTKYPDVPTTSSEPTPEINPIEEKSTATEALQTTPETQTPSIEEQHSIYQDKEHDDFDDDDDDEDDEERALALKRKLKLIAKIVGVIVILVVFFILWKIIFSTDSGSSTPLDKGKETIVEEQGEQLATWEQQLLWSQEEKLTDQKTEPAWSAAEKLWIKETKKIPSDDISTNNDTPTPTEQSYTLPELQKKLEAQRKEGQRLLKKAKIVNNKTAIKFSTTVIVKANSTLDQIEKNSNLTADEIQKIATRIDLYLQGATQSLGE